VNTSEDDPKGSLENDSLPDNNNNEEDAADTTPNLGPDQNVHSAPPPQPDEYAETGPAPQPDQNAEGAPALQPDQNAKPAAPAPQPDQNTKPAAPAPQPDQNTKPAAPALQQDQNTKPAAPALQQDQNAKPAAPALQPDQNAKPAAPAPQPDQNTKPAPLAPQPDQNAKPAAPAKDGDSTEESDSHLYRYAGIYTLFVSIFMLLAWTSYIPKRSAYRPTPETELCARLVQAERLATDGNLALPPGCQSLAASVGTTLPSPTKTSYLVSVNSFKLVPMSGDAEVPKSTLQSMYWSARVEDLLKDLVVWNRYEDEFWEFMWGKDLNWYLHASLRTLVIILSAVTPALIVAPLFAKKKYLAALPAAIVAIGTACVSEFDFKSEAASYNTALVQVQGEKTAFITRSSPLYYYDVTPLTQAAAQQQGKPSQTGTQTQQKSPSTQSAFLDACTLADSAVPFSPPHNYSEARANFACRIQQILQTRTGDRVQFLRGGQTQRTPPGSPAGNPSQGR
jgi:hypothetical protein